MAGQEKKKYKVVEGGSWIYGLFYQGGAILEMTEKQAKYLVLDHTVEEVKTK